LKSLHIDQALGNIAKLIMALDQKPFLKYLKFLKVDFSTISPSDIKALSRCRNLDLLEFIHCKGITLDHCTSLSNNPLDNLKELKLLSECFDSSIVNSLIEIWGQSLERLYLDKIKTHELSKTLISRCSNLKYLHVYIREGYEFLLPFLSQSSLQHFTITSYYTDNFSYKL
ncbi:10550_t:CDS:1, partial [Dentiscutata heterogama]